MLVDILDTLYVYYISIIMTCLKDKMSASIDDLVRRVVPLKKKINNKKIRRVMKFPKYLIL